MHNINTGVQKHGRVFAKLMIRIDYVDEHSHAMPTVDRIFEPELLAECSKLPVYLGGDF